MEVVCLILGPTLTSQPCSHAFWVLTSLHLPSFLFLYNYNIPSYAFAIIPVCGRGAKEFVDCKYSKETDMHTA